MSDYTFRAAAIYVHIVPSYVHKYVETAFTTATPKPFYPIYEEQGRKHDCLNVEAV